MSPLCIPEASTGRPPIECTEPFGGSVAIRACRLLVYSGRDEIRRGTYQLPEPPDKSVGRAPTARVTNDVADTYTLKHVVPSADTSERPLGRVLGSGPSVLQLASLSSHFGRPRHDALRQGDLRAGGRCEGL